MTAHANSRRSTRAWAIGLLALSLAGPALGGDLPSAAQVLKETGVAAGLAVVVGTTDGALEVELTAGSGQSVFIGVEAMTYGRSRLVDGDPAAGGRLLVHGLALSDEAAARARKHIFEKKRYGLASVSRVASARTLPYYERIVNLLVADLDALGKDGPSREEINRVLGYEGVAYLKQGGRWTKTVKPMPPEVAEWTHVRGDGSRNSLSQDRIASPPNAVRWFGLPVHDGPAYGCGARTSDGTHVQILPTWSFSHSRGLANTPLRAAAGLKAPGEVALWARDVNSGVLLWSRIISDTKWHRRTQIGHSETLVATGGRVYALDFADPKQVALKAWDIRTGRLERVFDQGGVVRKADVRVEPDERGRLPDWRKTAWEFFDGTVVIVHDGKVIHALRDRIVALDARSGERLWQQDMGEGNRCHKAVLSGDRVVAVIAKEQDLFTFMERDTVSDLVAVEAYRVGDGRRLWRYADLQGVGMRTTCNVAVAYGACDGRMVLPYEAADGRGIMLLDTQQGKVLWQRKIGMEMWSWSIVGDRIYCARGSSGGVYDLATGRTIRGLGTPNAGSCSLSCATPNWYIHKKIFAPIGEANAALAGRWYVLRSVGIKCSTVPAPSYGAIHSYPSVCSCETMVPGCASFYAIVPTAPVPDARRLERTGGAALGAVPRQSEAKGPAAFGWVNPHDPGVSFPQLLTAYQRGAYWYAYWQGYGLDHTEAVQAGDLTLAAYPAEHRLAATRDGQEVWNYVADGRIGSPPVVHDGRAIFGSHDGYVHAVNLKDGSRAWRLLAAPADLRHVAYGQLESAWPVFNVVLHEGRLYCSAGRQDALDGGIHFYCLDPASGAIHWHVRRARGIETDRTPLRRRASLNAKKDELAVTDGRAMTNDAIAVKDGQIWLHGQPMVALASPRDTTIDPETLVPPQLLE